MPVIEVPGDPHRRPQGLHEGHFGDILFEPLAPPEPDPEMTDEERQYLQFLQDTPAPEHHGGAQWSEPVVSRSEICVFAGWPRRHIQVGQHCPHGMLEEDDDEQ
jgi:hypothetical protein